MCIWGVDVVDMVYLEVECFNINYGFNKDGNSLCYEGLLRWDFDIMCKF